MRTTRTRRPYHLLDASPGERLTEILGDGAEGTGLINATEITDAQIGEYEVELTDLFAAVRAGDVEGIDSTDIAVLSSIRDGITNLRALASIRIDAAEALAAEIDAIVLSLSAEGEGEGEAAGDGEGEGEGEGATTTPVEGEGEGEGEATGEGAGAPEAVAAGAAGALATRPPLGAVAANQPGHRGVTRVNEPSTEVPRGLGAPVGTARLTIDGRESTPQELAQAMANRAGSYTSPGKYPVGHIEIDYPADRVLEPEDTIGNGAKLDAVLADAMNPDSWDDALVAAGGFCAEPVPTYDFVLQAVADRPVRDSMPNMNAERGAVRIPVSPMMSAIDFSTDPTVTGDPQDGTTETVSVWTNDNDIDAVGDADLTKPIQRIECQTSATFETYAVVKRMLIGNFVARNWQELVQHWNGLGLAAQSRVGETILLNKLKAEAKQVTTGQTFGAARDILEFLIRAGAFMRNAERTGAQARLRAYVPAWVVDLMAADLVRAFRDDPLDLVIARQTIVSMLGNANINPTFYIDSPTTGTSQLLRKQVDGTGLAQWPCEVQIGLQFEGTTAFLDQGTLDLGLVRSPERNKRNDYETFTESFEGLAVRRGPERLWITGAVLADGSYAAGIDGAVSCGSA